MIKKDSEAPMQRYKTPSCFVLLLIVCSLLLCAFLPGCAKNRSSGNPPSKEPESLTDMQQSFNSFTDRLFCDVLSGNTLNLHYTLTNPMDYGIDSYTVSFGNFTLEAMKESMNSVHRTLDTLYSYNREELTADQQLTYDVMVSMLETEASAEPCLLYTELLAPTTGFQAQLPVLLAEYRFTRVRDVEDYLSLLEQIPAYFEQIVRFEQEKSAAGLFMADYSAEQIIAQCRALVNGASRLGNSENPHFLQTTFQTRLASLNLSETETDAYISRHNRLLRESFFPAYDALIEGLQGLLGTGVNEEGLCHYPLGRDYYSYLAAVNTGSADSVEVLNRRILSELDICHEKLRALINEHPSLVERLLSGEAQKAENQLPDDPEEILTRLSDAISEDFPVIGDVSFQTRDVDDSLKDFLSPAFYLTPTLDCEDTQTIYINDRGSYTPLSLFTTLSHEGFPGHLYQNVFAAREQFSPVRALFCPDGYSEGWATYAEMYAYDYSGLDPDLCDFARLNSLLSLAVCSALDIGIHYNYWSPEDACEFLNTYGHIDEAGANALYQYIVEEPANYLTYFVGYLEFTQLKEQSQEKLGGQFDLKTFHTRLLKLGEAPFSVLQQYMQ